MKFIEKSLFSKLSLKVRRSLSITITFLLFFLFIIAITSYIYPQIKDSIIILSLSVQGYLTNFETIITDLFLKYKISEEFIIILNEQFQKIVMWVTSIISNIIPYIVDVSIQIASSAINLIMAFIMAVYMLSSKESLTKSFTKLLNAIVSEKTSTRITKVLEVFNTTFSAFIGGQITEAIILTVLTIIGMLILKLEYAILIGTIAGVMSVIPMFGAILGAIPGVLILMMISPMKAVIFIVFIVLLQQFEGNIIYPRVVGKSIGLSGLWIIFAMLLGGGLYGVLGILIGIPLFAVIYSLLSEWAEERNTQKELLNVAQDDNNDNGDDNLQEMINEDLDKVIGTNFYNKDL